MVATKKSQITDFKLFATVLSDPGRIQTCNPQSRNPPAGVAGLIFYKLKYGKVLRK